MSWVGVDLDGTLAVWRGAGVPIGPPVDAMVDRVRGMLLRGMEVRVFTARASIPILVPEVERWCVEHIGRKLEVTNRKDFGCVAIYDDIAHRVVFNTGVICD